MHIHLRLFPASILPALLRIPVLAMVLCCGGVPPASAASPAPDELARWEQQASRITIIRDTWGVPHIYGQSDADAVFGFLYAQAEDDFKRIELNYINSLGRLAEVEGEAELYRDLRMKLFIDPADLRAKYAESPAWLRALMDAFADGLNYYLHTHPEVKPRLITRFEPWMALSFSEGSIGGDIENISTRGLEQLYGKRPAPRVAIHAPVSADREPAGSNGFAIAPSNTVNGHALLMINPHTTFYFRPEVHVVSDEGLNAYGAVTWGQFFIYQGFNDRVGWMHTSGGGDVIDEYLLTVVEQDGALHYRHGDGLKPLVTRAITLPYRDGGVLKEKTITAYYSHHGPVVREADGKWVAVRLMQEPLKAIQQSYLRTKARNYLEFYRTMELRTNSSNNTVYADADGNIAYFHGNFIPVRDPKFDFSKPVDGSDPATDWKGLHAVDEIICLYNPPNGWIQNTNNWPFSAAGPHSPRREDYPAYMWERPENYRGLNAVRVLSDRSDFTVDSLIAAAYTDYLIGFESLLPPLLKAYDALSADDPLRARLRGQIETLRSWDLRCNIASIPSSLAIYWGQELSEATAAAARARGVSVYDFMADGATDAQRLAALARASEILERDFGTWKTPWGEINRFQRLSGEINAGFDDSQPSLPVGFASANWGSLAAYGPVGKQNTKRIYGMRGNSFVAAVEFGPRIRAKSVLAGGVSGDPASPHFNDQAEIYARGQFKDVLFYREDVERLARRTYRPGK